MKLFARIKQEFRRRSLLKKGYSSFYVSHWSDSLKNAYKSSDLPKKERKWAYDRGFFPWRIKQYGLTEDNYRSIFSDEDYYYLYPLNNKYCSWIDDKLTTKYVLAPFNHFLPEYYYHLLKGRDVMRLMDCPQEFTPDLDGLLSLLREKKCLAAKKSAGSLGVGFYKLEAVGDGFVVNGSEKSKTEFRTFLQGLDDYIITEFVEMHPDLYALNPLAVNTVRASLINRTGNDPILPMAFLRVGTKETGAVDNLSQGGLVCKVDVATGRFYDAKVLKNDKYERITHHPDTQALLEGYLPNWDLVKSTLLQIAYYCPQLTWLGFDIAITKQSFKIIEVNSHQGIDSYRGLFDSDDRPAEINEFLFSELEKKKKRYHIDL